MMDNVRCILFEPLDPTKDTSPDVRGKMFKISFGGGQDYNLIFQRRATSSNDFPLPAKSSPFRI